MTGDVKPGFSPFKITIIGLGLIGGSFAYALRGFRQAYITGVDVDPAVLSGAKAKGAVDEATDDTAKAVSDADLVILCVYPHLVAEIIKTYGKYLKDGAVVTDACGVKAHLYREISPCIPDAVDYVGIHPMAGKEVEGFENAEGNLFLNTGFIIVPLKKTRPESIELLKEAASFIGVARVSISPIEEHDEIIAYTSDLMHISASALCMDFHPKMTMAFTAGAFRDCTRIANINPALWTELLLENGHNTIEHLDVYIENLNRIRKALSERDAGSLYRCLDRVRTNKKEMMTR